MSGYDRVLEGENVAYRARLVTAENQIEAQAKEIAELRAALADAERAFAEVAEAYLKAGNNQGAGALQYAARYMSDILARYAAS